jgi:hypothetical protein
MMQRETDAAYFARRAREEAFRASQADRTDVAAAHRGLAVRYEAMARHRGQVEETGTIGEHPAFFRKGDGRADGLSVATIRVKVR